MNGTRPGIPSQTIQTATTKNQSRKSRSYQTTPPRLSVRRGGEEHDQVDPSVCSHCRVFYKESFVKPLVGENGARIAPQAPACPFAD